MTWKWVGFEANVKCFKKERYIKLWEGFEGGLGVNCGEEALAGAGKRRRRECGRADRLSLGSQVWRGPITFGTDVICVIGS